jgi:hypothetical protein
LLIGRKRRYATNSRRLPPDVGMVTAKYLTRHRIKSFNIRPCFQIYT